MIYAVLIGLINGVVAKVLMPGRDPAGYIISILLGISVSVVIGFLGRFLAWPQFGQAVGFIGSVMGAMVLLVGYRMMERR